MIDEQYYGHAHTDAAHSCPDCALAKGKGEVVLPIDMSKYLDRALRDLYHKKVDPQRAPDPALFDGFRKTFDHAVDTSVDGHKQSDLAHALKSSNEVFAAFRAHRMGRDMAAKMTDDEGQLKSFSRFRKDVEPIADHHIRQWLRTEYNMAVSRAHLAADWETYEKDRDLMPNLRWVESTAVTPEATHRSFWGMVRPVDDAFWAAHHPGDHWGCQCSLEQTDDPVTPLTEAQERKAPKPSPGLEENPGKTKRIFSDRSPYFPGSCGTCPFRHLLSAPRTEKDCYNCPAAKESFQNAYANKIRRSSLNTTVILSNDMRMWKRISRTMRRSLMLARRSPEKDAHLLLPRSLTEVQ